MSWDSLLKKIIVLSFRFCGSLLSFLRKQLARKLPSVFPPVETERRIPRLHFGAERAKEGKEVHKGILKTEQIQTLEVMPDDVKILYTKILAAQALADQDIDSHEFSDLYVFMAQIGLDAAAREQVRKSLVNEDCQHHENGGSSDRQSNPGRAKCHEIFHY
jgi:hypothetical protein